MSSQLPLPFSARTTQTRESFIVAPCNESAFRMITRWPDWPAQALALHGPKGCGKTHLAHVWTGIGSASLIATVDLLSEDRSRMLFSAMPASAALAVDGLDLEGHEPTRGYDSALMSILDRREGTTLLLGRGDPKDWPSATGDLKSRFLALVAFPMWAPDDELLFGIARKLFADRQLPVKDTVIKRMVERLERTPDAIDAFVTRLDERALAEQRPITERLVSELLEL